MVIDINRVQELDYNRFITLVKDLGFQAMEVISEYGRQKIGIETLALRLKELSADKLLSQYWGMMVSDPKLAPCLEILQIIMTLAQDAEYQLCNYGTASFLEDLRELMLRVKALG